jgi:hypothetical protein
VKRKATVAILGILAGCAYAACYAKNFTPVEDAFSVGPLAGIRELGFWSFLNFVTSGWLFIPFGFLAAMCLSKLPLSLTPWRRALVGIFIGLAVSAAVAYLTVLPVFIAEDGISAFFDVPGLLQGAWAMTPFFAVGGIPLLLILAFLKPAPGQATA